MSEMINDLQLDDVFVKRLWVIVFLFIVVDAYRRIRKVVVYEWDITSSRKFYIPKRVSSSLTKLYSKLLPLDMYKFAESIAVELLKSSSIFFGKSIFEFLKIRKDVKQLNQYFINKELVSFFSNTEIWVNTYILRQKRGFFMGRKSVTSEYLEEINRLIKIFKSELSESSYSH